MDRMIVRLRHWHCLLVGRTFLSLTVFFNVLGVYFIIVNNVFAQTRILLVGNRSNLKNNTLLKIRR